MDWKTGDWVVLDLSVGQIKELREEGTASFSDGFFETSGRLVSRFRPLTLRNKRIVETFEIYYKRLSEIDGNAGFNFPDIAQYFEHLALLTMDASEFDEREFHDRAQEFVNDARGYKPVIQGVQLFRPRVKHG